MAQPINPAGPGPFAEAPPPCGPTRDFAWCLRALPPAVGGAFALLALLSWLLRHRIAAGTLPPVAAILAGLLPIHVAAFGVCLVAAAASGPVLRRLDLTPPPGLTTLGAAAAAARLVALFYPCSLLLTWLTASALQGVGVEVGVSPFVEVFCGVRNRWQMVVAAGTALVLAPLAEEVVFRLMLHEALTALRVPAAAGVGAAVFVSCHGLLPAAPALFCLALLLQWARRRHRTLLVPVLMHTLFNGLSLVLLLLCPAPGADMAAGRAARLAPHPLHGVLACPRPSESLSRSRPPGCSERSPARQARCPGNPDVGWTMR
ncbi:MAG: CAAX amino terminal protease self- immunity [Lentisphaerae bacterium ADurb.BinA184]|nr:MAG: CAAX amino terminal protease self- immunity [Lentisphaerae bacterium ADurb.BinA184]